MSCIWFGWAWQELCYKRRRGERGPHQSQFDDGLIGWRKWATRRQSSFHRWAFDETGGVSALVQRPAPSYEEITIPIEKSLHFRGQRDGNNPEGWALGESAYEPWYFLKNLHIISGIGWERTFIGLPVFEIEEAPQDSDTSRIQSTGQALIVGEKQYVSVPAGVNFRLETVHNTSAESLLNQMKYERRVIMQTLLADFLDLGTGQTGSWALGQDKSILFLMAVDGVLDRMADIINRFAVTRLMAYNRLAFPNLSEPPQLAHKKVEKPALAQLGAWLQQVQNLLSWGEEDEAWLRHRAGMPTIDLSGETEPEPDVDEEQEEDEIGDVQDILDALPDVAKNSERAHRRTVALARYRRDREIERRRDELEEDLVGDVESWLGDQEERVLEEAPGNPDLADDEEFWSGENQLLLIAFLPALLQALNVLGEAQAAGLQDLGAVWTEANPGAAAWLRNYAFELVTNLNDTTRENLREQMISWAETGGDVSDLARLLRPTFGKSRAQAIAASEITRADAAAAEGLGALFDVTYAITPPTRTNCRCRVSLQTLPNGEVVGVWLTARDDRVSTAKRVDTPWGERVSDADLEGIIVSEGPYLGRSFDEVAQEVQGA
jgi:hypothetical protein